MNCGKCDKDIGIFGWTIISPDGLKEQRLCHDCFETLEFIEDDS